MLTYSNCLFTSLSGGERERVRQGVKHGACTLLSLRTSSPGGIFSQFSLDFRGVTDILSRPPSPLFESGESCTGVRCCSLGVGGGLTRGGVRGISRLGAKASKSFFT